MTINITHAETDDQIAATFDVMLQLRPHLEGAQYTSNCGSLIYIDDLVVDERLRSRGYGAQLIARLKDEGRALGCSEIQLISRVTREQAHRFYFHEGFGIECFHFRTKLSEHPA